MGFLDNKPVKDITDEDLKIIEDITVELDEADESLESEDTMTILERYVDDLEETVDKTSVVKILKTLYLEAIDL